MSEAKMVVPFVSSSPDPEVPAKAQRRKFSAEDKKRILDEVERATGHGGIGAVLRREGIYSSTLYGWRKERDAAVHRAFSQKRGPRSQRNPLAGENDRLRRQNQRLQEELEKAHIVIDIQKNHQHHHSGLGLMIPAMVHHGQAPHILAHRQVVLDAAYSARPESFVRKPPRATGTALPGLDQLAYRIN